MGYPFMLWWSLGMSMTFCSNLPQHTVAPASAFRQHFCLKPRVYLLPIKPIFKKFLILEKSRYVPTGIVLPRTYDVHTCVQLAQRVASPSPCWSEVSFVGGGMRRRDAAVAHSAAPHWDFCPKYLSFHYCCTPEGILSVHRLEVE